MQSVLPSFLPPVPFAAPPCRNSLLFQFVAPAGLRFPRTPPPIACAAATTSTSFPSQASHLPNSAAPAASHRQPLCAPSPSPHMTAACAAPFTRSSTTASIPPPAGSASCSQPPSLSSL